MAKERKRKNKYLIIVEELLSDNYSPSRRYRGNYQWEITGGKLSRKINVEE
jgi:hypothetical protein